MNEEKRFNWIISIRAFAAAAVVLLHVVSGWGPVIGMGGNKNPLDS